MRKYEAAAKRDFFEALRAYPLAEALAPEPAATASVEPPAAVVAAPDPAPVADLPPVAALFVPNSLPGNDLIEPLGSFEPPTPGTASNSDSARPDGFQPDASHKTAAIRDEPTRLPSV